MKFYKNILLAIISITIFTNGFSQSGQVVYDDSFVHEIRITFTEVNFWDTLTTHYDDYNDNGAPKQYMMALVEFDGVTTDSVGIRQNGNFSNWGAGSSLKKPLKIDFKEFVNQKFDGLKKINLNNSFKDPSMMRDALAYQLFKNMGIPAPRASYAKVYLNNTYWGLYSLIEQVDSEFIEDHYDDDNGNLYKCIDNTNLDWQGANWTSYDDEFALKTNKTLNDNTSFIDFVDKVNNTSSANFKDSLTEVLVVEEYLSILAADVVMYNWDSYYDHGRNFYMYQNPDSNKFEWIPWDYNLSFSTTTTDIIVDYGGWFGPDPKPLVENIQTDAYLKQRYYFHLCKVLNSNFNLTRLEEFIDSTAARIRPALDLDPNKFFTTQQFDDIITNDVVIIGGGPFGTNETHRGLKSFITDRYTEVVNELSQAGYTCNNTVGIEDKENDSDWNLYPNPTSGILNVDVNNGNQNPIEIKLYNVLGELIVANTYNNQKIISVDMDGYKNGLYLIKIKQGSEVSTKRVVKN